MSRRSIALQAVNVTDPAMLLSAPLCGDLFGGMWLVAEVARRKRTAERTVCARRPFKQKGPQRRLEVDVVPFSEGLVATPVEGRLWFHASEWEAVNSDYLVL
jgi:hypothetical protein